MKLIIDDKIPYIRQAVQGIADEVVYAPGNHFSPALVHDADALIIRTRTRCDRQLLQGSRVRFIATATIGFDHIDADYCRSAGIGWSNAPGCNAASVAQYLQSALLLIQSHSHRPLQGMTLGIIGVGHVGSRVAQVARRLGMRVLLNDPPRQSREEVSADTFVSLRTIAEESDIITLHVPLSHDGPYPTYHLADASFFASLRRRPYFINTSRGEVTDTLALKQALRSGILANAVIDVWEHEPDIDRELLQQVMIGTPHIAGYSADGKANATRMALDAVCRFFHLEAHYTILPPPPASAVIHASTREEALLQIYNPLYDSFRLKEAPQQFEAQRGNYPLRREEEAYHIIL